MEWIWKSLFHGLTMLWATFWALVLGFGISAVLQVFVSKEQISRAFGKTNWKSVLAATGFGAASSSCSYAAAAAARSAIQQGAALIPALAFMFASTNLVIELGGVLWILMGWRFVLAEFLGAFFLIGLIWILIRVFMPQSLQEEAQRNAALTGRGSSCHEHSHQEHGSEGGRWTRFADAFVMDWMMLWKELLAGFFIAGFIATLVPHSWWATLFFQSGPAWLRLVENALVGPIIAIASFVCSVGNIPLASHLWSNGISFGGVISFLYGDLLVIPLIIVYTKYYGARATAFITAIFYFAMVLAGLMVDLIFSAFDLIPQGPRPPSTVEHAMITWNYTSWLDLIALVAGTCLVIAHFRARSQTEHGCHECSPGQS